MEIVGALRAEQYTGADQEGDAAINGNARWWPARRRATYGGATLCKDAADQRKSRQAREGREA